MIAPPDPTEPVRVVVVGAGAVAEVGHLAALRGAGAEVEVVEVVDVQPMTTSTTTDLPGDPYPAGDDGLSPLPNDTQSR